ncbi:MAG TPA: hypothetical protein VK625_10540, partial [Flavitalea sp.]|nr:hypothetical protein [Flavitalea sp.]
MKNTIKQLIPPLLIRILKRGSKFGWKGNYKNWKAAMENCSGYNAANILEVVRQSTLKVKNG